MAQRRTSWSLKDCTATILAGIGDGRDLGSGSRHSSIAPHEEGGCLRFAMITMTMKKTKMAKSTIRGNVLDPL
jgi:hypothetical protein